MPRRVLASLAFFIALSIGAAAQTTPDVAAFEKTLAAITQGGEVTVVHFWAPWCPNCQAELGKNAWRDFISVNPDVKVVFVTVWNAEDGRPEVTKHGLTEMDNFLLLHHPNHARAKAERVDSVLGLPLTWIPSTWIFKEGRLRYALNYGEVRFPLLQQLVRDSAASWDHEKK